MSPEEFYQEAKKLYDKHKGSAGEFGHMEIDELMENCLRSLGYDKGMNVLSSMTDVQYS